MALVHQRPPLAQIRLWLILILFLFFGGLSAYHFLNRARPMVDQALLRQLQTDTLQAAEPKANANFDWPQWRGPNRDGVSGETDLLTDWPKDGPKVLWRARGGAGYSAVAVAGGRAYTMIQDGENEVVICWNADDGKELWRFPYPCKYDNSYGGGPRSTPTIDGELLYSVGATGIFHCLNAKTGAKQWRHDLLEEFGAENLQWGVSFSPLIEGDLIYTSPGGANGNSLAAFNKQSGELAWKSLNYAAGYSSPIAVTMAGVRQILFFTAAGLQGVSPKDGTLYWHYPWETDFDCNVATPIQVGDYVFISSGYRRGCTLLKVLADGGGKLEVKRVYENDLMCNHFNSSVYFKEHLYGFNEATLTCMEFRTGKVMWKEKGFDKGSLMIAAGQLIVLGERGKLALAEATPEGYREKASYRVFRNKCWTVPVLANGKLYLRDEDEVVCLDVRKR